MMRPIFFLIFLSICLISNAQDTSIISIVDTSSVYFIKLVDNTTLSGKIIERNNSEIIFNDITIGKVTIPVNKIEKFTQISGNQYCIITTHDGKKFTGLIISQNEIELGLKTESLGVISIPNSKIREIILVDKTQLVGGKYLFPNPYPTRYFFGPSAIPLEKGEGYYQNAYVLANGVQFGVTDHFSIGGGIVIPFMFFITPKVGYKLGKNVYLGGGILVGSSFIPDLNLGLGVGYTSLTLGNKENNFTINAGYGFSKQEVINAQTYSSNYEWQFVKMPMFSFSGALRLAPKLSLISENWVFPLKRYEYNANNQQSLSYKYGGIYSFGFRIMGEKNSFDIAIAIPSFEGETVGLPYIDYVFKF